MQKRREDLFKNQFTGARIQKINKIEESGLNPYGNSSSFLPVSEITDAASFIQSDSELNCNLRGRIRLLRKMGKMEFITLEDIHGDKVQLVLTRDETEDYATVKSFIDIMDIIEVSGYRFKTERGMISLKVKTLKVVTKSTAAPIGKHSGLQDEETKLRQRYLDMIANPEVKNTLIERSKMVSKIRRYFEDLGFLEVETPMLNAIPGGANARPFITHHNSMGVDRYLRIAPELYLKKLIVGGMQKVFEIGKNFRNEGVDATHNPEFTAIEFYESYASYEDHMDLIEKLLLQLVTNTAAGVVNYQGKSIDFMNWKRVSFRDALIQLADIPEEIVDEPIPLAHYLVEQGINVKKANGTLPLGKLWEVAFDEYVEDKLIDPTFIIDYPADISPLARRKDDNPSLTERFELFIAGREIANGFNELNNPFDQYDRFKEQVKAKDSDDESMHMDEDFVQALMVGMVPTAGCGIGIDRLIMLLTDSRSIRDVIAFPAVK